MQLEFAIFTTILGFAFLLGSFFMKDKWGSIFLTFNSMLLFFFTSSMMLYITEPYVAITSTDTIITGTHWITDYQPFSIYYLGLGFFSMIWLFIQTFYDMLLPKLKELGVK